MILTVYRLAFTGGPLDGEEVNVVDEDPSPLPGVYARPLGNRVEVTRTPRPGSHRYKAAEVGPLSVVVEYAPR